MQCCRRASSIDFLMGPLHTEMSLDSQNLMMIFCTVIFKVFAIMMWNIILTLLPYLNF